VSLDYVPSDFSAYSLHWADEFDGPAGRPADSEVWQRETGGHGWGNEELQYYTGSTTNAALDGAGHLAITVRRAEADETGQRYGGRSYTSARLITKDKVSLRYGLVQARIKVPRAGGIWPAFWLLGQDFDQLGWPNCGEIDVMEHFGTGTSVIQGALHGPGYCGGWAITGARKMGRSLGRDFHVYSVGWEPGRIRWYVDDKLYHTVTPADLGGKPWVFDHDFFLLLNVAVGGLASRPPDHTTSFPQVMLVDYVRSYAPALCRAALFDASQRGVEQGRGGDPGRGRDRRVVILARRQHPAVIQSVDLPAEQHGVGRSGCGGQFGEQVPEPAAVGLGNLVRGAARPGFGRGPVKGAAAEIGAGEQRGLHVEDAQQALAGIVVRVDGRPQPGCRELHPVFEVGPDQLVLAAEVAVQRGARDIGPFDDPVDADAVHALGVEQLIRGLQQALAGTGTDLPGAGTGGIARHGHLLNRLTGLYNQRWPPYHPTLVHRIRMCQLIAWTPANACAR
jgi:beta-glucanase (GH16 family)